MIPVSWFKNMPAQNGTIRLTASQYALIEICRLCKKGKDYHENIPEYGSGSMRLSCPSDMADLWLQGGYHERERYTPMDNLDILRYASGEKL